MFSRHHFHGSQTHMMNKPRSCDTFVALAPATADGHVVFGKNSDRPTDEVQEVIHVQAMDHAAGSKVQVCGGMAMLSARIIPCMVYNYLDDITYIYSLATIVHALTFHV